MRGKKDESLREDPLWERSYIIFYNILTAFFGREDTLDPCKATPEVSSHAIAAAHRFCSYGNKGIGVRSTVPSGQNPNFFRTPFRRQNHGETKSFSDVSGSVSKAKRQPRRALFWRDNEVCLPARRHKGRPGSDRKKAWTTEQMSRGRAKLCQKPSMRHSCQWCLSRVDQAPKVDPDP